MTTDRYGREWDLPPSELCPECGQPDNCDECDHTPLSDEDVEFLRGEAAAFTEKLRGMTADYDPKTRTFSVTGISAKDAHTIIWRGGEVADAVLFAIRHALVRAQDNIMPNDHYEAAVEQADADERIKA